MNKFKIIKDQWICVSGIKSEHYILIASISEIVVCNMENNINDFFSSIDIYTNLERPSRIVYKNTEIDEYEEDIQVIHNIINDR